MNMLGKVKKFNKERGYGFITIENESRDIFFHFSDLEMTGFKTIDDNSDVEFELTEGERGLQAKHIKKIK